jgi:hypothetical protein
MVDFSSREYEEEYSIVGLVDLEEPVNTRVAILDTCRASLRGSYLCSHDFRLLASESPAAARAVETQNGIHIGSLE